MSKRVSSRKTPRSVSELNPVITKEINGNVKKFKTIIDDKMRDFYYDDELSDNFSRCCEECCDLKQMAFLVKTSENFLKKTHLDQNIAIKAIVYYFFQMVILETQYTDLLETSYFLNPQEKEYNRVFHQILAGFIFGDEPEYMEVRKKFLNFSKKPFSSRSRSHSRTEKKKPKNKSDNA